MRMPVLETERLRIRPFAMDDLDAAHRILDVEPAEGDTGFDAEKSLADRREWLQWSVLNAEQLARMHQPPYGDRAMVLRSTGELVGACGFVPSFDEFARLPSWKCPAGGGFCSPELGLYYAVAEGRRRSGYAAEAARALIGYAFSSLRARRVVATTEHSNAASIAVMRSAGMRIERNPGSSPPWLQAAGVIDNPAAREAMP